MFGTIRIGDPLPELAYQDPDGTTRQLADIAVPTLLIFLRHLH